MAFAYTKEFLVGIVMQKYDRTFSSDEDRAQYRKMLDEQYDKQGKEKFRQYASLDAAAVKEYKNK